MFGTIHAMITRGKEDRFGFIRDEEGFDRYFHARDLVGVDFGDVAKGTRVEFTPTVGGREGRRAEAIHICVATE